MGQQGSFSFVFGKSSWAVVFLKLFFLKRNLQTVDPMKKSLYLGTCVQIGRYLGSKPSSYHPSDLFLCKGTDNLRFFLLDDHVPTYKLHNVP